MERNRVGEMVRPNPEMLALARESMERVLQRSAVDMEFRRELLTSPRMALSRHFGRPLPESFNVVFIENTADATIVLPEPVNGCELSDAAMEVVNGGNAPLGLFAASVILRAAGHLNGDA